MKTHKLIVLNWSGSSWGREGSWSPKFF